MNPAITILLPGFWQLYDGHIGRGVAWMTAIVLTSQLVLPAIALDPWRR